MSQIEQAPANKDFPMTFHALTGRPPSAHYRSGRREWHLSAGHAGTCAPFLCALFLCMIEVGGRKGTLAMDTLDWIRDNRPDVYPDTTYTCLEISSKLAAQQYDAVVVKGGHGGRRKATSVLCCMRIYVCICVFIVRARCQLCSDLLLTHLPHPVHALKDSSLEMIDPFPVPLSFDVSSYMSYPQSLCFTCPVAMRGIRPPGVTDLCGTTHSAFSYVPLRDTGPPAT
eukprot:1158860-Pelagomonas_calceolata.AAC.3